MYELLKENMERSMFSFFASGMKRGDLYALKR